LEIYTVGPFLSYYEKVRGRTLRVAAAIPRERFDWTYREGKFTFADLLRHLGAIERYMFAENARLRPSRYPGHGRELADGPDEVMAFLDRTHRESVAILAALSDEDLKRRCMTPGGAELPVWKWLRSMVEHEIHHRGQIYVYLSMLGITGPPIYGLTSEQVLERSRPVAAQEAEE
jgi:uncharacterized damage-inducible protein DinB